ncbi:hypothetical protein AB3K78_07180 [Leucobacter sp. HNU]|uniref:glycosyltransferase family 39 protein n=1 Tax=Leucobacter sp. HNU TaxID=3236805 RepID=UPI003A7F711C
MTVSAVRAPSRWVAPAIGAFAAIVGFWGAWIPSYWGDEAASLMSAVRPLASLPAELLHVDAVHGVYYLLLHAWVDLFGLSEAATRSLSAIAIGLAASGIVLLGARWWSPSVGATAGIVFALLPRTTDLAIEARSYALAIAAAVWLTLWIASIIRRGGARRLEWVGYAVATAASGALFLYLLFLPAVHLATALTATRVGPDPEPAATRVARTRVLRGWLRATVGAAVLSLPFVAVTLAQKDQVAFLANRGYLTLQNVFATQWFSAPGTAVALWIPIVLGIVASFSVGRRGPLGRLAAGLRTPASAADPHAPRSVPALWPTLVWLLLPTLALVLLDIAIAPSYNMRYTAYSLPAAALLAGAGLVALSGWIARVPGASVPLVICGLLAVAVAVAPHYTSQRTEFAKDGGADFRAAADAIAADGGPGDALLFGESVRPSRNPRLVYRLYPDRFTGMADPQLRIAYDRKAGLWDTLAPVSDVASGLTAQRLWLIERPAAGHTAADTLTLMDAGYRLVQRTTLPRTEVLRFERTTGGNP